MNLKHSMTRLPLAECTRLRGLRGMIMGLKLLCLLFNCLNAAGMVNKLFVMFLFPVPHPPLKLLCSLRCLVQL